MMMLKKTRGFTLIELMIVVAIVGIIVAFGYPSYREQVLKSRRTEGIGELLELADRLERYYSDQVPATYAGVDAKTLFGSVSLDGKHTTAKGNYKLDITVQDAISFTVEAVPQGKQATDKCGTFTLTSLGVKSVSCGAGCLDDCWK